MALPPIWLVAPDEPSKCRPQAATAAAPTGRGPSAQHSPRWNKRPPLQSGEMMSAPRWLAAGRSGKGIERGQWPRRPRAGRAGHEAEPERDGGPCATTDREVLRLLPCLPARSLGAPFLGLACRRRRRQPRRAGLEVLVELRLRLVPLLLRLGVDVRVVECGVMRAR